MIETCRRPGFRMKKLKPSGSQRNGLRRDHLDRHIAMEQPMEATIHAPHFTGTDKTNDIVPIKHRINEHRSKLILTGRRANKGCEGSRSVGGTATEAIVSASRVGLAIPSPVQQSPQHVGTPTARAMTCPSSLYDEYITRDGGAAR